MFQNTLHDVVIMKHIWCGYYKNTIFTVKSSMIYFTYWSKGKHVQKATVWAGMLPASIQEVLHLPGIYQHLMENLHTIQFRTNSIY